MESHDLPVDAFATPSGVTKCEAKAMPRKPFGVRWDLVGADLEHDIGALRELRGLDPQALAAHRAAARRFSAPIADQTAEEWQALTDACVSLFAAEEAKWSDGGPSGKSKSKGKGYGKARGKLAPEGYAICCIERTNPNHIPFYSPCLQVALLNSLRRHWRPRIIPFLPCYPREI